MSTKSKGKIILNYRDREEIRNWELLENIVDTSEELLLVVAECKDFVQKNRLQIKPVTLQEAEAFTTWYRESESLGTEGDSGSIYFVKRHYRSLKTKFTVQRLQNIRNWYHVFDPCLMLEPSNKLLSLVPDLLTKIVQQENWDLLFSLIGGLYYLDELEGIEDSLIPNVHKILYTRYRYEVEQDFLKTIDNSPEVQKQIKTGTFALPFELNGIVKTENLVKRYCP